MINYNPKTWFGQILYFPKSDTMRILWQEMLIMGLYTGGLTWVLLKYSGEDIIVLKSTLSVHSLIGIVMGLFLVFRTNTAYDRWWEGRKQWGALVNSSRNLAMKLKVILPENTSEKKELFQLLATFPFAAKEHLRLKNNLNELHLPDEVKASLRQKEHLPLAIVNRMYVLMKQCYDQKKFSGEELIIIDNELNELMDIMGACERIRSTPIPYSYSLFMKKFIFVYSVTLPFGLIPDFNYMAIPVTILVFYIIVSLEILAEEIEDPFGYDDNDLPTDELSEKISGNISEIKS